jgi:hypothetical protein
VSVKATADDPLTRTLDASQGLTRLGSTADQTLWRVVARPSAVAPDVPVPPSRVRLDNARASRSRSSRSTARMALSPRTSR